MEKSYKDPIFGEMIYKHRWYKKQQFMIFGTEWEVTVVAKAYSGKPITEAQQNSYSYFCKNVNEMTIIIAEKLKEYINKNLQQLEEFWMDARAINSLNELAQVVIPKTLLFKQDGTTIMLLDCIWDEDHGIAVKLTPEIAVGSQDIFL